MKIQSLTKKLMQMHFDAKVGHLGGNISCLAGIAATLSKMEQTDRFILSKGHSAGALYVALCEQGVISEDELKTFHKDGTRLPGHPPVNLFEQIPFATGSLGHGLSLAAGFALSQSMRGRGGHTYCLTSDGEWQEGSTWEALIFACHRKLRNLTILVDHNGLQGFGSTQNVASMDPLWERIRGFDLEILHVDNGHDIQLIQKTLNRPQNKVRAIFLKTTKGKGIADVSGTVACHYLPPTETQLKSALKKLEDSDA